MDFSFKKRAKLRQHIQLCDVKEHLFPATSFVYSFNIVAADRIRDGVWLVHKSATIGSKELHRFIWT